LMSTWKATSHLGIECEPSSVNQHPEMTKWNRNLFLTNRPNLDYPRLLSKTSGTISAKDPSFSVVVVFHHVCRLPFRLFARIPGPRCTAPQVCTHWSNWKWKALQGWKKTRSQVFCFRSRCADNSSTVLFNLFCWTEISQSLE
jgi:hypothetical protein